MSAYKVTLDGQDCVVEAGDTCEAIGKAREAACVKHVRYQECELLPAAPKKVAAEPKKPAASKEAAKAPAASKAAKKKKD